VISIEVLGLQAVLAGLSAKGAELATDGTRDATLAAAERLHDAWVANIEAEGLVDTGRYRDSITVILGEPGQASVHTDVPYAPLLEHGTAHMGPHPVAERALEESGEAAVDAAGESIRGRL
jgi:HK97 gp10 family phage protein